MCLLSSPLRTSDPSVHCTCPLGCCGALTQVQLGDPDISMVLAGGRETTTPAMPRQQIPQILRAYWWHSCLCRDGGGGVLRESELKGPSLEIVVASSVVSQRRRHGKRQQEGRRPLRSPSRGTCGPSLGPWRSPPTPTRPTALTDVPSSRPPWSSGTFFALPLHLLCSLMTHIPGDADANADSDCRLESGGCRVVPVQCVPSPGVSFLCC